MDEREFQGTARFEVRRRIGAGGMGVVYEAFDRERNAVVALKTLKTWSADAVLRFKNEFRQLQDVRHRNLVSLGELFEDGGHWFFTMELIERGVSFLAHVRPPESLEDSIEDTTSPVLGGSAPTVARVSALPDGSPKNTGGADERRLRAGLVELARGLQAIHGANKVHRDIKPSNILVTRSGRVVILDFGVVTDAAGHGLWPDDHLVGTVSYMAPEQATARPVGPEADWYSVGVVLYQALTGRLPFIGPPDQVLRLKQTLEPRAPRHFVPEVSADLDRLCVELLRLDPGKRPSAREVLRRLGADPADEPATTRLTGARFVGRRRELEELHRAFAETRVGTPLTVVISGESGVGKSALLRRFTERALGDVEGAVVFASRCHERESVPYKAVDGIVDSLSRYLTSLPESEAELLLPDEIGLVGQAFPVMRRLGAIAAAKRPLVDLFDPRGMRTRLFAALRELFITIALRHPLVLLIDDLQWADADGLALLTEVMRPPRAPSLLLVATVRSLSGSAGALASGGDAARTLDEVSARMPGEVRRLAVESLPPDDARELVDLLVRESGAKVASASAIAREAGGHPLFIDELVRCKLLLGEGAGLLRLEEALWTRIARLEESDRALLELVTVAGGPLAQETIAHAAGTAMGTFVEQVARLRSANLVKTVGVRRADTIEPYHDRVGDAVRAHLDAPSRQRHHRRLALALEAASGGDAEALSAHWSGAGDADKAAEYAARAAEDAANALAFDRAARLFRLALGLRPPTGIEGARLRTRLGDALANGGRGREAAESFLLAASLVDEAGALDLRRRAAEQLLQCGHIDEGVAVLRTVLAAVGTRLPETPRRALASLLMSRVRIRLRGLGFVERAARDLVPADLLRIDALWSAAEGFAIVDTIRGADFQTRGLLLALAAGEPVRVARSLAAEAAFSASAGGPARARTARLLAAAEALAKKIDHPNALATALASAGLAAFLEGRWRDAVDQLDRAEELFLGRCTGVAWELHTAQLYALIALTYLGDLAELARRHPARLRDAEDRGNLYAATTLRTALPAMAWLVADDVERARGELGVAMRAWSRQGFHLQHYWTLLAEGQIDLYAGAHGDALRRLTALWPALGRSLLLRIQVVRIEAHCLRARLALAAASDGKPADRARLLADAERDARRIAAEKMAWSDPIAELLLAAVARARGDDRKAIERLGSAIAGFDGADMALHAAAARLRRGTLRGAGEGKAEAGLAEAWLAGRNVAHPRRLMAMIAPGFGD